jgi:hypothetical protein
MELGRLNSVGVEQAVQGVAHPFSRGIGVVLREVDVGQAQVGPVIELGDGKFTGFDLSLECDIFF